MTKAVTSARNGDYEQFYFGLLYPLDRVIDGLLVLAAAPIGAAFIIGVVLVYFIDQHYFPVFFVDGVLFSVLGIVFSIAAHFSGVAGVASVVVFLGVWCGCLVVYLLLCEAIDLLDPVPREAYSDLADWSQQNPVIDAYHVAVSSQGRQITQGEWLAMKEVAEKLILLRP